MSRYRDQVKNLSGLLGLESYGRSYSYYSLEELEEAIAEDNAEIQETEADLNAAGDTMDQLAVDSETVSNVSNIVDDSIESGEGLSETSAELVQEAVESIMRRHGMPRRTWPNFPSKESFSSGRSRLEATRRLKVSIEEGIFRKMWTGIKNLWQKIKNMFRSLWDKLFGKGKKTEDKADEKVKELQEAQQNGETEAVVDASAAADLAEEIADIPDAPSPEDFDEDGFSAAEKALRAIEGEQTKQHEEMVKAQEAVVKVIKKEITVEEAKAIIKADIERKAEAAKQAKRQKVNEFTEKIVKVDRVLNSVKGLKSNLVALNKQFGKKNKVSLDTVDGWIKDVEGLMSKAENTANETEIQNLVNIAISRVKDMEGNMTRLNKVGIDMADALLNGTRARKDKKAKKENKRIAEELKNRSFEKSNRRFGSFRRYSR